MGQKKNRDAEIEQLYREMFDSLIAYAACSLRNYSLAEEAVQETFRIACAKQDELFASPNRRGCLRCPNKKSKQFGTIPHLTV